MSASEVYPKSDGISLYNFHGNPIKPIKPVNEIPKIHTGIKYFQSGTLTFWG